MLRQIARYLPHQPDETDAKIHLKSSENKIKTASYYGWLFICSLLFVCVALFSDFMEWFFRFRTFSIGCVLNILSNSKYVDYYYWNWDSNL